MQDSTVSQSLNASGPNQVIPSLDKKQRLPERKGFNPCDFDNEDFEMDQVISKVFCKRPISKNESFNEESEHVKSQYFSNVRNHIKDLNFTDSDVFASRLLTWQAYLDARIQETTENSSHVVKKWGKNFCFHCASCGLEILKRPTRVFHHTWNLATNSLTPWNRESRMKFWKSGGRVVSNLVGVVALPFDLVKPLFCSHEHLFRERYHEVVNYQGGNLLWLSELENRMMGPSKASHLCRGDLDDLLEKSSDSGKEKTVLSLLGNNTQDRFSSGVVRKVLLKAAEENRVDFAMRLLDCIARWEDSLELSRCIKELLFFAARTTRSSKLFDTMKKDKNCIRLSQLEAQEELSLGLKGFEPRKDKRKMEQQEKELHEFGGEDLESQNFKQQRKMNHKEMLLSSSSVFGQTHIQPKTFKTSTKISKMPIQRAEFWGFGLEFFLQELVEEAMRNNNIVFILKLMEKPSETQQSMHDILVSPKVNRKEIFSQEEREKVDFSLVILKAIDEEKSDAIVSDLLKNYVESIRDKKQVEKIAFELAIRGKTKLLKDLFGSRLLDAEMFSVVLRDFFEEILKEEGFRQDFSFRQGVSLQEKPKLEPSKVLEIVGLFVHQAKFLVEEESYDQIVIGAFQQIFDRFSTLNMEIEHFRKKADDPNVLAKKKLFLDIMTIFKEKARFLYSLKEFISPASGNGLFEVFVLLEVGAKKDLRSNDYREAFDFAERTFLDEYSLSTGEGCQKILGKMVRESKVPCSRIVGFQTKLKGAKKELKKKIEKGQCSRYSFEIQGLFQEIQEIQYGLQTHLGEKQDLESKLFVGEQIESQIGKKMRLEKQSQRVSKRRLSEDFRNEGGFNVPVFQQKVLENSKEAENSMEGEQLLLLRNRHMELMEVIARLENDLREKRNVLDERAKNYELSQEAERMKRSWNEKLLCYTQLESIVKQKVAEYNKSQIQEKSLL